MNAPPPSPEPAPVADRHTVIGICLNLLLLVLIGYGYVRSEDFKYAWVLVGAPIGIVTLRYAWHLASRPWWNPRGVPGAASAPAGAERPPDGT